MVSANIYLRLYGCKSTNVWEFLQFWAYKQGSEAQDIKPGTKCTAAAARKLAVSGTRAMKGCMQWGRKEEHLSSFLHSPPWACCQELHPVLTAFHHSSCSCTFPRSVSSHCTPQHHHCFQCMWVLIFQLFSRQSFSPLKLPAVNKRSWEKWPTFVGKQCLNPIDLDLQNVNSGCRMAQLCLILDCSLCTPTHSFRCYDEIRLLSCWQLLAEACISSAGNSLQVPFINKDYFLQSPLIPAAFSLASHRKKIIKKIPAKTRSRVHFFMVFALPWFPFMITQLTWGSQGSKRWTGIWEPEKLHSDHRLALTDQVLVAWIELLSVCLHLCLDAWYWNNAPSPQSLKLWC